MTTIKILDGSLTAAEAFAARAVGFVYDALSCKVKEKLNGAFTAEIKLPITSQYYEDFQNGAFLLIKPNPIDNEQMFRVTYEDGEPLNGVGTFTANHISYDLNSTFVVPFDALGAQAVVSIVNDPTYRKGGAGFTLVIDALSVAEFESDIPRSVRGLLSGWQGSIIDVYGGDLRFDNFTVRLMNRRGGDCGYRISYSRNLTDYRQERNLANVYTAAVGFAKPEGGNTVISDMTTLIASDDPKIKIIDFSERFAPGAEVTKAKVNSLLSSYLSHNDITSPKINIRVRFVHLPDTEEYKDVAQLRNAGLGDTVAISFPTRYHGMSATARVIEYEYDALMSRYNYLEIGEPKTSLIDYVIYK